MKLKFFLTFSLMLSIFSLALSCNSADKIAEGDKVIIKIEKFRNETGRLPNSLTEIDISEKESGPIYYQKKSDSKYILWFGKELGESMVYDSETKEWK